MKLVEVEADNGLRTGKWERVVVEFYESGMQAVEVVEYNAKVATACTSIRRAIRESGYPIKLVQRKERIYLLRTDDVKK